MFILSSTWRLASLPGKRSKVVSIKHHDAFHAVCCAAAYIFGNCFASIRVSSLHDCHSVAPHTANS